MNHHSAHNSAYNSSHHPKGSILIWSVLLGFVLTSVFFFFGMRQRANIAIQRDTALILNSKMYLESYADYLEANAQETAINFDGIKGGVTKIVNKIEGIADIGVATNYQFGASKQIFVEWNKCSDNLGGGLMVNGAVYTHDGTPDCDQAETEYDDVIGPITVTDPIIETANAPFYFRITGTDLTDNEWHLELERDLGYGKKTSISRTFPASP